jgi:hypothetical protein
MRTVELEGIMSRKAIQTDEVKGERRHSMYAKAYVRVSPAGRLEVDGKRLFRSGVVKKDIADLRAIPIDSRL